MKFIFSYFLLVVISLHPMSRAAPLQERHEHIGVQTISLEDAKRKRPVLVELWYPTETRGPFDKPSDLWIHPKEVRGASFRKGKYPLVVMSHGHAGDRRDRSWIAEHLVQNGFMVASIEHHGNSWKSYSPFLTMRFWDRARDISYALNHLLTDPHFKELIDSQKVGFVGYSLGGMTGLALAGAHAKNVKEIMLMMQKKHKEIDSALIEKIDFSEAYDNFSDPRIKAFVLLSPATFIFPANSLKSIKAPIALVASEADEVLPHKEHALKVIQNLSPKKLMLLQNKASHYVFLNRVSEMGKKVMHKEVQASKVESDRVVVHKKVGKFIVDFFKEQFSSQKLALQN